MYTGHVTVSLVAYCARCLLDHRSKVRLLLLTEVSERKCIVPKERELSKWFQHLFILLQASKVQYKISADFKITCKVIRAAVRFQLPINRLEKGTPEPTNVAVFSDTCNCMMLVLTEFDPF